MTESARQALVGLRDWTTLQWYVVPFLALLFLIYVQEIRVARATGNWDCVIAGVALFSADFVNETINETTIINEAPPSSPWATPDTGSGWQQASSDTGSNAIDWDDSASSGGDGGGWGNDDSA